MSDVEDPSDHRIVKLFGTHRSGTNYLQALLELNYRVSCLGSEGAWKHAPYPAVYRNGVFVPLPHPAIGIAKSPLAAMISMFRYHRARHFTNADCGKDWDSFLRSRLIIFDAKQRGMPSFYYANPMEYWNSLNHNIASLPEAHGTLVKYEDLLTHPAITLDRISADLGLQRKTSRLITPKRVAARLTDTSERRSADDYQEEEVFDRARYYVDHGYLDDYSPQQVDLVLTHIDETVADRWGYGPWLSLARQRLSDTR